MKRLPGRFGREKGAVLFVVLLFSLVMTSVMVYTTNMVYQRTRLVDAVGIKRTKTYFRAQAGLVDAFWRIRTNHAVPGLSGNFSDPNFSAEYYIDIDSGIVTSARTATSAVKVTIGPRNVNVGSPQYGLRPVSAVGFDS